MSQPRDVKISASSKDEGFDVKVNHPSPPCEDSNFNVDDANDNAKANIESAALPEKGSKIENVRNIIHAFLSKFAFGSPCFVILVVGALAFAAGGGVAVYKAHVTMTTKSMNLKAGQLQSPEGIDCSKCVATFGAGNTGKTKTSNICAKTPKAHKSEPTTKPSLSSWPSQSSKPSLSQSPSQSSKPSLSQSPSQSSKPSISLQQLLCDTVQCGQEFTNGEKVTLIEDLKCGSSNPGACAIKLVGPDAELDCSNYRIKRETGSWTSGICLSNGARAKNCYVEKFSNGIYIKNGGEVEDSEVMFNNHGIDVDNTQGSTTKISNTYVHDNTSHGIDAVSGGSESSIQIQGVRSNNNGQGMNFVLFNYGDITVKVKDSETSNNERSGIFIFNNSRKEKKLNLEGSVFSRYNGGEGMSLQNYDNSAFVVTVKGVLNIYKNRGGLYIDEGLGMNVVVEEGGYLNSCKNTNALGSVDMYNDSATFGGQGTFTCQTTGGGANADFPDCETCPSCEIE